MNLFGRTWQVQVQAEAEDRASIDDIYRINVRNADGEMIPLRSLVEVRVVIGPQALIRYNNRLAVTVQGSPAPGVSSGQALAAMDQVAAKTLPRGYRGAWTDISFQEKRAEGKTAIILGFAMLFAYLFLVALYESWTIPVPVLLSVSVGVVGAFVGIVAVGSDARSLCADRHGRADRAGGEERHPDRGVRQGAARARRSAAGSRDRGRAPALPPGDDDIVRVHPRPGCRWSSPTARRCWRARTSSTPVFGGMIAASFLGIFVIPPLYVTFQGLRERLKPSSRPRPGAPATEQAMVHHETPAE